MRGKDFRFKKGNVVIFFNEILSNCYVGIVVGVNSMHKSQTVYDVLVIDDKGIPKTNALGEIIFDLIFEKTIIYDVFETYEDFIKFRKENGHDDNETV
jgi:hypothetical protein